MILVLTRTADIAVVTFLATMMVGTLVLPPGIRGLIEAPFSRT
jgi:hypothetical protein